MYKESASWCLAMTRDVLIIAADKATADDNTQAQTCTYKLTNPLTYTHTCNMHTPRSARVRDLQLGI
jgi:hypothetical protein